MYNSNWDRWIFASVSKFFDTNKGDYTLFIEGDDYDKAAEAQKKVELRINGPITAEVAKGQWKLHYSVNCLVSVMRSSNTHVIYGVTGQLASIFKISIPVYKYGKETGDDGSLIGCLARVTDPDTTQLGQVDPNVPQLQATVEAEYKIQLEN